ncbi:MAG: GAF domain-containing sensor histidine kinase, partial [Candidatus Omnitrophica bacterium]|nr:GAF domain-containing sensor histidine kinase [Candidatus Omnitrophota bacterium]
VFAGFAYLGSVLFENVVQNRWIAMIPSVAIVVLLLRPLENLLRNVTDRYLFQKKYDYRELLRMFTDEVLTVLDLKKLISLTIDKLVEIVKLEKAAIVLYDEDANKYGITASTGFLAPIHVLEKENVLITYMEKTKKYVLLSDSNSKVVLSLNVKKIMEDLNLVLALPLIQQGKMIGALLLGKKKSDEEFSPDDINILSSLTGTLTIAITNAQLFEKLSEAQAQAAQQEKMAVIGTLSAGINHEICNPLGIARGQCEMFLLNLADGVYGDKKPEELLGKARDIMNKVIHETDRATVITRKLSSFAKPAKGETDEDVNIAHELEEVIALLENEMKLDNKIIKREISDDVPHIVADRKQLQEIFFNITRNAEQAIKGSGEITIRAFQSNGKVQVEIEDTGEGISSRDLEQIFDPFFTTKEPGKGTGLGLFIVKQIVEKNNGEISVKSREGKGTVFTLLFKMATADSSSKV